MTDLKSKFFGRQSRPLIFGHRGVPVTHQENTMAGFREAIALGLDGVELDVWLTKDGKLIVFHDFKTKRLTGVSGKITKMTWPEIQQLTIKSVQKTGKTTIDYGKEEHIPLLEDVLKLTRGKLLVNLEIKSKGWNLKRYFAGVEVARILREMKMENDVLVTSFDFWSLLWLGLIYPELESGLIYSPMMLKNRFLYRIMKSKFIRNLTGSTLVSLSLTMFHKKTIKKIHRQGLAVGAWTIFSRYSPWYRTTKTSQKELEKIRTLAEQGIDFFITDDPERLKKFLNIETKIVH